jgi:hypothetical protein
MHPPAAAIDEAITDMKIVVLFQHPNLSKDDASRMSLQKQDPIV